MCDSINSNKSSRITDDKNKKKLFKCVFFVFFRIFVQQIGNFCAANLAMADSLMAIHDFPSTDAGCTSIHSTNEAHSIAPTYKYMQINYFNSFNCSINKWIADDALSKINYIKYYVKMMLYKCDDSSNELSTFSSIS